MKKLGREKIYSMQQDSWLTDCLTEQKSPDPSPIHASHKQSGLCLFHEVSGYEEHYKNWTPEICESLASYHKHIELMDNPNFSASYHRSGSEEKLVYTKMSDEGDEDDFDNEEEDEDDENLKEEEYDFAQVSIPTKHIRFVTDASLSSWSEPEKHWEKTSCLG